MAQTSLYLSLIAVFCCALSYGNTELPPFAVIVGTFEELEDLGLFFGDSYRTDAVQTMTAEIVPGSAPYQGGCPVRGPISVEGNMNCLLGYWGAAATSSSRLSYQRWLGAQREECDYTIGYSECLTEYDNVDQNVCLNPNVAVDGNADTVWAHAIQAGQDTRMKINLHGRYKVAAVSLDVESVPLDFTISLRTEYGAMRDVVTLQQETCDGSPNPVCLQYTSMNKKVLTVSWDFETEDDLIADELIITFHGVDQFNFYRTNYYIIREIKLLAMPVVSTTTTTTPAATTSQVVYTNKAKGLRQILLENAWRFEEPYTV